MGYEVHILTDPGNNVCWWNFPWVKICECDCPLALRALTKPLRALSCLRSCSQHGRAPRPGAPGRRTMLRKVGLDPKVRRSGPQIRDSPELHARGAAEHDPAVQRQGRSGSTSSAPPTRCAACPRHDSAFMLLKLAEAYPSTFTGLALYDEFVPPEYKQATLDDKITQLEADQRPALLLAASCAISGRMTTRAAVVVAPDSMMVHLAGCMGVPCVGLWGPMSPEQPRGLLHQPRPDPPQGTLPALPVLRLLRTRFRSTARPETGRTTCEVIAGISPS
jgi:hypothetical protein